MRIEFILLSATVFCVLVLFKRYNPGEMKLNPNQLPSCLHLPFRRDPTLQDSNTFAQSGRRFCWISGWEKFRLIISCRAYSAGRWLPVELWNTQPSKFKWICLLLCMCHVKTTTASASCWSLRTQSGSSKDGHCRGLPAKEKSSEVNSFCGALLKEKPSTWPCDGISDQTPFTGVAKYSSTGHGLTEQMGLVPAPGQLWPAGQDTQCRVAQRSFSLQEPPDHCPHTLLPSSRWKGAL